MKRKSGEKHQENDHEDETMFPEPFLCPGHLLGVTLIEPDSECGVSRFNGGSNRVQFGFGDGR